MDLLQYRNSLYGLQSKGKGRGGEGRGGEGRGGEGRGERGGVYVSVCMYVFMCARLCARGHACMCVCARIYTLHSNSSCVVRDGCPVL